MKLPVARAEETFEPHRGVAIFSDYAGEIRERCEVLVVGSGPGGAVVAKELAERGRERIRMRRQVSAQIKLVGTGGDSGELTRDGGTGCRMLRDIHRTAAAPSPHRPRHFAACASSISMIGMSSLIG